MVSIYGIDARVKWEPLKTPGKIAQVIGGNSLNDYWLLDSQKTILHFDHGKWVSFPFHDLFPGLKARIYNPVLLNKDLLVVLLVDYQWRTYVAEIRKGKIRCFGYVCESPLYHVTLAGSVFYVTGDFGMVLKFTDDHWSQVPSPITAHIFSAVSDSKGTLWLGTFGQGLFSWDGKHFREFPLPEEVGNANIPEMKFYHDTLYVNTSREITYRFVNHRFRKVDPKQSPFIRKEVFTKEGYYVLKGHGSFAKQVPYLYKIRAFQTLSDGHSLLLTQSEELMTDRQVKGNFLMDFASVFGLSGPEFSFGGVNPKPGESKNSLYRITRPEIIISDFNNDRRPDILLFNISDRRRPYLFLNENNGSFTNYTVPLGLADFSFNGLFTYAYDLNGDRIPEIITSDYQKGSFFLRIYSRISGKYQTIFTYKIPKQFSISPITNIAVADIDQDGDLDILAVYGYSRSGKGTIQFLKNDGYGNFKVADTSSNRIFTGWNDKVIPADFDNDGRNDLLVVRNWRPNALFFKEKDGNWTRVLLDPANGESNQRKRETIAFDFDNDGDLDIFSISDAPFITALQNDGNRHFTNITDRIGLGILNQGKKIGNLTAGDLDNNGYIDLYFAVDSGGITRNYIFLNDSARRFEDRTQFMGLANSKDLFAAVGDLDLDGDLDLYGYREGKNQLWINNLDSNNYLRLRLKGVKANSQGIGARIWVYQAGHLDDPAKLAGYRQVGSMMAEFSNQNEAVSHFGLKPDGRYDVRVLFPGGKTKILKNIRPGTTLEVAEIGPPLSWIYQLDNAGYKLVNNREFQFYFVIVVLGLFAVLAGVFYGVRKFRWDVRLTSLIIIINLVIFAILSLALHQSQPLIKYFVPLTVILLGSAGPVGFFLWIKKGMILKSQKEYEYELFQSLLNFSHGAWASSNLNSLLLFFENLSLSDLADEMYRGPFEKRKETFMELTRPLLEEIISLLLSLDEQEKAAQEIGQAADLIVRDLKTDLSRLHQTEKEHLAIAIRDLKESLSKLKVRVFVKHSCYPTRIIRNLQDSLKRKIEEENVHVQFVSFLSEDDPALMDATGLAHILDNCIQNAIRAMAPKKNKELTIKLLKADPRILIEVTDNGVGIAPEHFQQIFENGYSTSGSSGYGLYYSKETLKKYGGRIYVKSSVPNKKTTITIELQKGEHHEATDSDY